MIVRMSHPDPDGPPDLTPIEVGEVWENPVTGERATISRTSLQESRGPCDRGANRARRGARRRGALPPRSRRALHRARGGTDLETRRADERLANVIALAVAATTAVAQASTTTFKPSFFLMNPPFVTDASVGHPAPWRSPSNTHRHRLFETRARLRACDYGQNTRLRLSLFRETATQPVS